MDVISATGGGGGGAGPAPFLLKTYEMVDDSQTDDIVSWNQTGHSFVVWNPPEFARILLPTFFKHNNFSSFIRQLNTYGFRKIDPERWEFANEEFMRDQKNLLKNIHRRKPIHSHSHPPGSTVDPERAAFEEEIHKLSREKSGLEDNILRFRQQHSGAKLHLNELTERVGSIEQRQENLLAFVEKAVQNPDFVERLAQKLESMDISAFSKKRRLPQVDGEDNISVGSLSHQDFSNKLRLELSPAVSDINVVSCSTQSSTEDGGGSPHRRIVSEGGGWSRENLISNEEVDGHILCQLNLSLASLPSSQMDKNQYSVRVHQIGQEIGADDKNPPNDNKKISSLHDETPGNKASTTQVRVNDVFWEQFLTEKPGCSDNEEASSSFRGNSYDEIDEKKSNQGVASNTRKVEHLTL